MITDLIRLIFCPMWAFYILMHILLPTQKWINLPLRIRSHLNKMKDKPYFLNSLSATPQNGQTHSSTFCFFSMVWLGTKTWKNWGRQTKTSTFSVFLLVSIHELHIIHVKYTSINCATINGTYTIYFINTIMT